MAPVTRSASASKTPKHATRATGSASTRTAPSASTANFWDATLSSPVRKRLLKLTEKSGNAFWITTEEALEDQLVKSRVFFGWFSGSGNLEIEPAVHGYKVDGHLMLWPNESHESDIPLIVPCNETQPHIIRWWQKFWDKDMKAKIIYLKDEAKKMHDIEFERILDPDGNFLDYQARLDASHFGPDWEGPKAICFREELQGDIWAAITSCEDSEDYRQLKYRFGIDENYFMIGPTSAFNPTGQVGLTGAENENVFLGRRSGARVLALSYGQPQSDKDMPAYKPIKETQSYHLPQGQRFWDRDMKAKIVYFSDEARKIHDIQFKRVDDFSDLKSPSAHYRAELNPLYFSPHCTGITLLFRGNLER